MVRVYRGAFENNARKRPRAIYGRFAKLGLDLGYAPRYSKLPVIGEFLCDLVWLELFDSTIELLKKPSFIGPERILRCAMACKIEWTYAAEGGAIRCDFMKLPLINTVNCVFVTGCRGTRAIESIKAALMDS